MPIESYISGKLLDTLTAGCISHLERKVRTSTFYQNIQGLIHSPTFPDEITDIFSSSINIARSKFNEDLISKEVIEESLKLNSNLLYEWVISFEETIYYNEIERVQYSDYDKSKELRNFFSVLYYQVLSHRASSSLVILLQNNNGIKAIFYTVTDSRHKEELEHNQINEKLDHVLRVLEPTSENQDSWEFSVELNEIENLLSSRRSENGRRNAFILESKIIQNNRRDEKEKLYQLIVNSYILELENQNKAIPYLKKLISLTDDPQKETYRVILLDLLEKKYNSALKRIEKIDRNTWEKENYIKIIEFRLNIYFNQSLFGEAIIFLNEEAKDYKDNLYWLADAYLLSSFFNKAFEIYSENLDFFNQDKFQYKKIKFEILLSYYSQEIRECKNTFENNQRFKELVLLADDLISQSINDNIQLSTLLCQKAYCLGLLDNYSEALSMFQKAEELYPENVFLLRNYPLSLLATGKQEDKIKGLELLSKYLEMNREDISTKSLYYKILIEINPKKAIDELSSLERKKENLPILILLSDAYLSQFMNEESLKLLKEMQNHFPNESLISMQVGNHYYRVKDLYSSLKYLKKSVSDGITEPWKMEIITKIGNLLLNINTVESLSELDAILFEYYDEEFILYNFRNIYLESLFRQGKYRQCLRINEKISIEGIFDYNLLRNKFYCFIQTKNYIDAVDCFNEMITYNNHNTSDLLQYAHCHLELGHSSEALRILPQLDDPVSAQDYSIRSQFLMRLSKNEDALAVINSGYEVYPLDRNIQEIFIQLVLIHNSKPKSLNVIENYQKCLSTYDKMPYDNKMLKIFSLPKDKSEEKLLEALNNAIGTFQPDKSNHKTYEHTVFEMRKNKLPISMNPRVQNENFIFLWAESIIDKETYFYGAFGNENDYIENNYINKEEIYIDLSSLLFIFKLHLEKELIDSFRKVYITQSIWSLILSIETSDSILFKKNGFNSVISEDSSVFVQYPDQFYKKIKDDILLIKTFIDDYSDKIEIVGEPLDCEKVHNNPFDKLIGKDYLGFEFEYITYGLQRNIPVMIDSLLLRKFFNNFTNANQGCVGIGLITFINHIATGKWTNDQYYRVIAKLISWGYKDFFINPDLFISTMKNQGYVLNNVTESVFSLLSNKTYNDDAIIRITVILLYLIWKEPNGIGLKKKWSDIIYNMINLRGPQFSKYFKSSCKTLLRFDLTKQDKEGLLEYVRKILK